MNPVALHADGLGEVPDMDFRPSHGQHIALSPKALCLFCAGKGVIPSQVGRPIIEWIEVAGMFQLIP